jgi:hypothetical protein
MNKLLIIIEDAKSNRNPTKKESATWEIAIPVKN